MAASLSPGPRVYSPVQRIEAARVTFEVTQAELAEALGINRGTLTDIEAGRVEVTDEWCKQVALVARKVADSRTR